MARFAGLFYFLLCYYWGGGVIDTHTYSPLFSTPPPPLHIILTFFISPQLPQNRPDQTSQGLSTHYPQYVRARNVRQSVHESSREIRGKIRGKIRTIGWGYMYIHICGNLGPFLCFIYFLIPPPPQLGLDKAVLQSMTKSSSKADAAAPINKQEINR